MFQIPEYVLENLKCSVCDGYLSTKPLMIKPENEQVCGKCFKIIPTEEKEKCLRQLGMEKLAELFVFPCRYNIHGCKYTFAWDSENNHEEMCQYRYWNLSSSSSNLHADKFNRKSGFDFMNDFANIEADPKERNYGKIQPVKNEIGTDAGDNIKPSLERLISLKTKSGVIVNDINENLISRENIYEQLLSKHCNNCKAVVEDDGYTCLFGHISCVRCKGNICVMCFNLLEKESKTLCKNYHKGCKTIFRQIDINKHHINCQYNDYKCPLEPCKFKGILIKLKLHLTQSHPEDVYVTNETTKKFQNKDETIIFLCYDSIFKCVYFYYRTFVEFFITYVGSSEEALCYTYEISVQSDGNSLTRRSRCSSWNDSMLEKGITFDRKDLVSNNDKKLNFEIHLKIIHIK